MNDGYVVNIFWSDSVYNGGKVYVLYSDNTWECIRTKHSPNDWTKGNTRMSFKQNCNLKILRQNKFTKEQTKEYIEQKDKEFISWREES